MTYLFCIVLILVGVLFRMVPHAPNFTPMLAIALMSGLYFRNKFSILLPIGIMLISDLFIGSHAILPWIYFSFLIIYFLGRMIKNNSLSIFLSSICSSILFFIISNFGVWMNGGYSYSIQGIVTCYMMAIPFLKNTLISTVLFSGLFYAIHQFSHSLSFKYKESQT
tara:strand:- start:14911 stop:15408 length:498 start_codon:yes stop_codon:yes gene_type:complete